MSNNTRLRCLTASAGTIIRRDFFLPFTSSSSSFSDVYSLCLTSVLGVTRSGFRPLTTILDCSLLTKSSSFFIASGTVLSSNTIIDFWLVMLSPLQLPNLLASSSYHSLSPFGSSCSSFIPSYGRSPFSAFFFPRSPLFRWICNVLDTPTVFTPSQDQTLTLIVSLTWFSFFPFSLFPFYLWRYSKPCLNRERIMLSTTELQRPSSAELFTSEGNWTLVYKLGTCRLNLLATNAPYAWRDLNP